MKGILTKREKEIFEMLIVNKTTKDISKTLNIKKIVLTKTESEDKLETEEPKNEVTNNTVKNEISKTKNDIVKLTHEQIAKYMGSAREVVSRMLKYFSSEGLISFSRSEGIKILDKKRLRALTV